MREAQADLVDGARELHAAYNANSSEIASTKERVGALETGLESKADKTALAFLAAKTELAAVKTTADATASKVNDVATGLAATKAIADAAKATAEAALPKSGGTMSGRVDYTSNDLDAADTAPESTQRMQIAAFLDKNGVTLGSLQYEHLPDSSSLFRTVLQRRNAGKTIFAYNEVG